MNVTHTDPVYVLGRSDADETQRLLCQAQLYNPP